MVNKPQIIALIPARGGSKGIPGKNIKPFGGFPLIAYSIIAGLRSNRVSRVIVSTDDEEIGAIAKEWGAEVPFLRPGYLAEDETPDLPVLEHCLDWLAKNEDYYPEVVVWLRPTSPIRPKDCVDQAIDLLLANPEADSVRGVVSASQNPFKMWTVNEASGALKKLLDVPGIDEPYNAPRQLLPKVFWQTGHIDALWTKTIERKNSMTGDVILPLIIDSRYTVDIDLPSDWQGAERILQEQAIDMVDPANRKRHFPTKIRLMILDFDGVLTDNRVWVNQNGEETIAANRSDGLGLESLRNKTDIEVMVLSRESNPVVAARSKKLKLPVLQAVLDKGVAISKILAEKRLDPSEVIFMGNDTNDLVAFQEVGFAVAPADAHSQVLRQADLILSSDGGKGAVRELCDMILSRLDAAA